MQTTLPRQPRKVKSRRQRNYEASLERTYERIWDRKGLDTERVNSSLSPEARKAKAERDNCDLYGDPR